MSRESGVMSLESGVWSAIMLGAWYWVLGARYVVMVIVDCQLPIAH